MVNKIIICVLGGSLQYVGGGEGIPSIGVSRKLAQLLYIDSIICTEKVGAVGINWRFANLLFWLAQNNVPFRSTEPIRVGSGNHGRNAIDR